MSIFILLHACSGSNGEIREVYEVLDINEMKSGFMMGLRRSTSAVAAAKFGVDTGVIPCPTY